MTSTFANGAQRARDRSGFADKDRLAGLAPPREGRRAHHEDFIVDHLRRFDLPCACWGIFIRVEICGRVLRTDLRFTIFSRSKPPWHTLVGSYNLLRLRSPVGGAKQCIRRDEKLKIFCPRAEFDSVSGRVAPTMQNNLSGNASLDRVARILVAGRTGCLEREHS